eukprot:3461659-Pleurochrysis_carterae.AAC.3
MACTKLLTCTALEKLASRSFSVKVPLGWETRSLHHSRKLGVELCSQWARLFSLAIVIARRQRLRTAMRRL